MIFYSENIEGSFCQLDSVESGHAVRVLRLKEGDLVELVDGKGGFYKAEISVAHQKKCQLRIVEAIDTDSYRNCRLHVAIAPTKNNDRFEWFLEKATELGIDRITPLLCDHSERKVLKNERMEKVLIAAMKQSQKAVLPLLDEMTPFEEFVQSESTGQKFIAYVDPEQEHTCKDVYKTGEDMLMLIGPEGDFSENELSIAKENGFIPVSLGNERLRTETAGMAACCMFNVLNFW